MNLNRDEFLLLSRTGRGPHSARAGPSFERTESMPRLRLFRKRRTSALSRARGYLDERDYHELEFLVGFPAEEETLL
jgi:hypothetical protein